MNSKHHPIRIEWAVAYRGENNLCFAPKNGKMEWIHLFCHGKINNGLWYGAKSCGQPVLLLCQRSGTRFVWFAATNVVSLQLIQYSADVWWAIFHFLLRLPFDWRNLHTYLLVVAMQCIAVTYLFYLISGIAAFGIGAFVFGIKALAEFRRGIERLGEILTSKTDVQYSMKCLRVFLDYHAMLMELSNSNESTVACGCAVHSNNEISFSFK